MHICTCMRSVVVCVGVSLESMCYKGWFYSRTHKTLLTMSHVSLSFFSLFFFLSLSLSLFLSLSLSLSLSIFRSFFFFVLVFMKHRDTFYRCDALNILDVQKFF